MSMKLEAGPISRQDTFGILPEHILRDDVDNSRAVPHSPEEIEALACTIFEESQLQAVLVRRVEQNKVRLIAGYGRVKAIAWINAHPEDFSPLPEPMKVLCRVIECSDVEAYVKSIRENLDRVERTPVDDAHAQRRLRDVFGWDDIKIANLYSRSVSYVNMLRKLPTLEKPLQDAVAAGDLAVATAVELANVPAPVRAEIVAAATDTNGHVKTAKVRAAVRSHQEQTGEGRAKHRTAKEVKEWLDSMTGLDENENVREFFTRLLSWTKGELSDAEMSSLAVEMLTPPKKGKKS